MTGLTVLQRLTLWTLCTAGVTPFVAAAGQTDSSPAVLTVTVLDRADDTPLQRVSVRIVQAGVEKSGITGAKGTVTFRDLSTGATQVNSERNGYSMRPQTADTTVRAGANEVRMTLLEEEQSNDYYRRAGKQIEAEGLKMPAKEREAFFRREWDRVKLLGTDLQLPLAMELKIGREYLSGDLAFQAVMKGGKIR